MLVIWCFEPSHPHRVIYIGDTEASLLKTKPNLLPAAERHGTGGRVQGEASREHPEEAGRVGAQRVLGGDVRKPDERSEEPEGEDPGGGAVPGPGPHQAGPGGQQAGDAGQGTQGHPGHQEGAEGGGGGAER